MTQKPQYTPGPWKVLGAPTEGMHAEKRYSIVAGDYSALIAETVPLTGKDHARYESLANARLIAAAPELLEALDASLNLLRQCMKQSEFTIGACSTVSAIQEIYAKARGEE